MVRKGLFDKLTLKQTWGKREGAFGMSGEEYFKQGSKYKGPEVDVCMQSSRESRRLMGPTDRGIRDK